MDFMNDWLSWSNLLYMVGLGIAGYATTVTAKNRNFVVQRVSQSIGRWYEG